MPEALKKISVRTAKTIFTILRVLVLVVLITGGFFAWRIHSSPLDLEFAKTTIQEALRDEERGLYVTAQKIVLHWPDIRGPLLLGLQGGEVFGPDNQVILSIDEAAIGIDKARLLLGQIAPEALFLKGPSLSIIRYEGNRFDFGLNAIKPQVGPAKKDESAHLIEEILNSLGGEESAKSSPLAKLKEFSIERARVVINDHVLGLTWEAITADARFMPVETGLSAEIAVEFPHEEQAELPQLKAKILLNKVSNTADISGALQNFSTAFLAEKVPELKDLKQYDGFIDAIFSASFDNNMQLSAAELTEGRLTFGDVVIEVGAEMTASEGKIIGTSRIEIQDIPHSQIEPLWPDTLDEENAREWVVDKLSKGIFTNVYVQSSLNIPKDENGWNFDADNVLENMVAGFEFEEMSINYKSPLAPITNAKGQGEFILDEERLNIHIDDAKLLDMDIKNAELELTNIIEAGAGKADIHIDIVGGLNSVLKYVADEPLGVKPDFDVANTIGNAALGINLQFPTKDDLLISEFDIDIQGTLSDTKIPNLIKTLPLSGGPFKLSIDNEKLKVSGSGLLAMRPVTFEYEEFLESKGKPYASLAKASLNVDPNLRAEFGVDLSEFLEGTAYTDVVYTSFDEGRAEADITVDLTTARLFVKPLAYEKLAGVNGTAKLKAVLEGGVLKDIRDLTGSAPDFSLEKSQIFFREANGETELASGDISRFKVRETNGSLDFEVTPSGLVKLVLNGSFLDLRPFLADDDDKSEPYDAPPLQVSIAVDQMLTSDEYAVKNGKLYVDIDAQGGFNQLEMDATAGAGDIYLRYKPDASGKRTFRFEADDAGAALAAFGLYDDIRGGKMVIYAEPVGGIRDRNLVGRAELLDFRVVDAPALAKLLAAMSLPGVGQTLNGEGLVFSKLEADFDWLYKKNGSLLVLKDGRTSGNSLGLTFDGTFDNAENYFDVSGTIIPLSGVNKIIGDIPLVGDIITGGTGALFAATYTMKGEGADAKVFVNPLSALTPGLIRRILFEN